VYNQEAAQQEGMPALHPRLHSIMLSKDFEYFDWGQRYGFMYC